MKTLELSTIINTSLNDSFDYQSYRTQVAEFAKAGKTSGAEPLEALVNYTMLNDRRMKRWDKTIKLSDHIKDRIKSFTGKMTWLVLTESWCGDAAHIIPILNKIAEQNDGIELKLVYRDEHPDLMDQFLSNGSRSIPKLIMMDRNREVLATYGPRPSTATRMVNDFKTLYGQLTPEFKEDLQAWYNKDKGATVVLDILDLLKI